MSEMQARKCLLLQTRKASKMKETCPKCKTPMTRKQFYDIIYGKDGTSKVICGTCKTERYIIKKIQTTDEKRDARLDMVGWPKAQ